MWSVYLSKIEDWSGLSDILKDFSKGMKLYFFLTLFVTILFAITMIAGVIGIIIADEGSQAYSIAVNCQFYGFAGMIISSIICGLGTIFYAIIENCIIERKKCQS